MKRARDAACWVIPSFVCLAVFWYGLHAFFQADDFAWLNLSLEVHDWPSLWKALFSPRAQGTVRPWSERAFFLGFYALSGLDALPFHIWTFLTQFANLALVASIARRLAGSRVAAFWAALFWAANSSLAWVMAWSSAYNQALCAFFLLLAFYFLLRFIETGRQRYEVLEWAVYLAGFGAQELNVVYPALAAGYTLLCARKHFRRTLPLFIPAVVYTVLHMVLVPPPGTGLYAMHFDASIFRTLATYWSWTAGPAWLLTPWGTPFAWVIAGIVLVTAALLGFAVWRAARGDRLPVFYLFWYLAVLGPLLPLRDHVTEYYPYVPSIGLAMLGGLGMAVAWKGRAPWKAAAALVAVVYLVLSVPRGWDTAAWLYRRSRKVERVVLGLERAHQLHPDKVLLLHGVGDDLFAPAMVDRPYRLFGASVFLTPETQRQIHVRPEYGDISEFVLPPDVTEKALARDAVAVYDVTGDRLKNITTLYDGLFAYRGKTSTPRRVEAGNPLMAYLLGPEWFPVESNARWMPKRATLRIGGPRSAAEKLYMQGICPAATLAAGPVDVTVAADGIALAPVRIAPDRGAFEFTFALPVSLAGRESIEIAVEVSRTLQSKEDTRPLGLSFGLFEIR